MRRSRVRAEPARTSGGGFGAGGCRASSRRARGAGVCFASLCLGALGLRHLVQRERQVDAPIERHRDRFGAVAVELEPQLETPSPLGQVSRNGVMPMTAPSFSRTTRAPADPTRSPPSRTSGPRGRARSVARGGAVRGRGRRRRDGHRVGGPRHPRPACQPQRHARRSPAPRTTMPAPSGPAIATRRRSPSRACAACVNVVGLRGLRPARGVRARRRGQARRRGVGRPVSAACTSVIVCIALGRAPWRGTTGSAARDPRGSSGRSCAAAAAPR